MFRKCFANREVRILMLCCFMDFPGFPVMLSAVVCRVGVLRNLSEGSKVHFLYVLLGNFLEFRRVERGIPRVRTALFFTLDIKLSRESNRRCLRFGCLWVLSSRRDIQRRKEIDRYFFESSLFLSVLRR